MSGKGNIGGRSWPTEKGWEAAGGRPEPSTEELVDLLPLHLPERRLVLLWMLEEWVYSNKKFGLTTHPGDQRASHDESMRMNGMDNVGFWNRQVVQYWDRTRIFGLRGWVGLKGRQAMLKSLITLFDCCASMVRVFGSPPTPGVPSGDISTWDRGEEICAASGYPHGEDQP